MTMTEPVLARRDADEIAALLGETEATPCAQILRVVERKGADWARALAREALTLEAAGGRVRRDGERRTVGGIFFRLAKRRLTDDDRLFIWLELRDRPRPERARASRVPSWAERGGAVSEAASAPGKGQSVKITLVGRPGKIVERDTYITTIIEAGKLPPLPKGLPTPPATTASYMVYIAKRHWNRVAAAIAEPEDALIIEGVPLADREHGLYAVFALHVTTKSLQTALRRQEAAAEAAPDAKDA